MGDTGSFREQVYEFLVGFTQFSPPAESPDERRNAATIRLLYQKFNENDLGAAAGLLTEDYVGLDVPSGQIVRGRDGWRRRQEANLGPMPDASTELRSLSVKGDLAVAEVVNRGTHTRPMPLPDGTMLPPSGRKLDASSCELYELRGGLIARGRLFYDFLTVARQLGMPHDSLR